MNQNIFCSKCHRIPNQCCCSSAKEQDTDCQYCKQGCIRCDARKQLTDEEIKFIAYPFESVYTTYDKQTDTDTVHTRFDQLGFARAILRKAQEK